MSKLVAYGDLEKAQLNWKHTVKHKPHTSDDKDKNCDFDVLSVNHGALSVQDYFTFSLCRKSTVIMKTSTVTLFYSPVTVRHLPTKSTYHYD